MSMGTESEILLIHLGALGDMCVSESTFLSLRNYSSNRITAVGATRILLQFRQYFDHIESIDSKKWRYLFSESIGGPHWPIIILIGKDPHGSFRYRLPQIANQFVFISMYPDKGKISAEDYQLAQLSSYGIKSIKHHIPVKPSTRIFLYPEQSYRKAKWPINCFTGVHDNLKRQGFDSILLRQRGLVLPIPGLEMPDSLDEVVDLFSEGGLFLSCDSGMAHFAARCGLRALCIFYDKNAAAIWQPRNSTVITAEGPYPAVEDMVTLAISFIEQSSWSIKQVG